MIFGAITIDNPTPTAEKIAKIKAMGMQAWQPSFGEFQNEDPQHIKDMATEHGIIMTSLAAGVPMSTPSLREQCLKDWRTRIEFAKTLGVSIMFSRSFPLPEGVDPNEAWKNCVFLCKEMTRMCTDNGLTFAFETDHENLIHTLDGALRLLDAVNMDEMKVNYDPTNFYIGGNGPVEVLDALFERVVHGHIKDAVRPAGEPAHEVPVGEGDMNYMDIFTDLRRRGYEGAMVIEHCYTFENLQKAWNHVEPIARNFM